MSNRIKPKLFCEGCLSTERKLSELGDIYCVYYKLLSDDPQYQVNQNPLMCWECKAMLKNIQKFQERVKQSYCYLNTSFNGIKKEQKSLSCLRICPQTYNIILYEKDIEYKEENGNIDDLVQERTETYKDDKISDNFCEELKSEDISPNNTANDNDITYYYEPIKSEIDSDGIDSATDYAVEIKTETTENPIKEKEIPQRKKKRRKSFTNIRYTVKDLTKEELVVVRKKCPKVTIDNIERDFWREKAKLQRNYRIYEFKCETCIMAFPKKVVFDYHMRRFHSKLSGPYECDICKKRVSRNRLSKHIKSHNEKYICCLCDYECHKVYAIDYHLFSKHRRVVECLKCKMQFSNRSECNSHYRNLHLVVKCDHCGRGFKKKTTLIQHLKVRHSENKCKECGRVYKKYSSLVVHTQMAHVKSISENTFCVECNIQFDNEFLFRTHLLRSPRHRVRRFPCPECEKVYKRRCLLTNHYNHIHLKKTKFYCELCDRYFLNGYRLREHKKATHDRIAPKKTKICDICKRSFATNQILNKHIRTHTGERPFQCEHCNAAFTQKTALVTHTKSIHKTNQILNKHIRTHTCERPFQCEHCNAAFTQKTALVTHTKSIHKTNQILNKHIRTHTGERPFKCEHCNAAFTQKTALVTHTKSIHKVNFVNKTDVT